MTTQQAIIRYEKACNDLIALFSKKQDLEFSFWIVDEVGGVACFSEHYYFNLSDIILDLKTNQKKGLILDWHDEDVEANLFKENPTMINYKAYTMGLRFPNKV